MKRASMMVLMMAAVFGISWAGDAVGQVKGNTFHNAVADFEVTKPDSWVFESFKQAPDSVSRATLSDEQYQKEMAEYESTPLVQMTKQSDSDSGMNATVKIKVKKAGTSDSADPKVALSLAARLLQTILNDGQVVQEPEDVEVAGLKAGHVRVDFVSQSSNGADVPMTLDVWIVPRGEYLFVISAAAPRDDKSGTRDEIAGILKSIRIEE